ncbi:MAG: glycosyltransferase [Terriglobales bacterium]|jgi:glycosyltransferase involved in cell wall biosynthesis
MTKFSLVIACYKQEQFIRETVDSALAQPYPNKEIIVVDDASPDRTARILEEYGDKIRLIKHEKNLGANVGRNEGAAAARGQYLVFLDGDDLYLPWALDLYARAIELKQPKIILGRLLFFKGTPPQPRFDDFGPSVQVVEYGALMGKDYPYRGSASAIVVDRQTFLQVGGFSKEFFPSDIDDLTIKLGYSGKTVHILSHPTTAYRVHANNTVHQIGRFVDTMTMVVRKEKNGEYPGGPSCRLERYAYIGGPVYYWFTRALGDGLYWRGLKFLGVGWQLVLVSVWSHLLRKLKGRRPVESFDL